MFTLRRFLPVILFVLTSLMLMSVPLLMDAGHLAISQSAILGSIMLLIAAVVAGVTMPIKSGRY